jgi:hypothetical protein
MNPLDKPKFDAQLDWHREHTLMDAETEARAVALITQWMTEHPKDFANFQRWLHAEDAWNNAVTASDGEVGK